MTIKLDSHINPVAKREGYSDTINPSAFVNAWSGTIQAGQQLQNFASKGFDMVVAEQKVYNSTQTDLLNIERKTKMNEFVNNTRQASRRVNLENDYRRGYNQINKDIIKKAPNDRIKALVAAEGNNYFASNFPSIQKEARVYRLNAQKTEVTDRVRDLRIESTQTDDLLRKQEIQADIDRLLIEGQNNGYLDPDEVSKERFDSLQTEEQARLTKLLFKAETEVAVDAILNTAKYMDDPQEKALLEIRAYGWVRTKKRANITAQDKAARLEKEALKSRQDAYERDISVRLYAPETADMQWSPVTMEELIEKESSGDISQSYFEKRKEQISQGYVFKNRQTRPDELLLVTDLIEKQLKDPYTEHIGIDDIELNQFLSNEDRNLLGQRLLSGKRTQVDNEQEKFRTRLRQGLNIDSFIRMEKMGKVEEKNRTLYEYELRTNPIHGGKEKPPDVYNEMMRKELEINTPTHQFNKLTLQGLEDRIPPRFRVFAKGIDKDTGKVPNIAAMKARIKAEVAGRTLDFDDAIEMTDVLKQMEDIGWDAKTIEQLGGIKSKKTLNAEKKEANQKEAEAQRLAKEKHAAELKQQEEDRLREEARIAKEKEDAEKAAQHQKDMEARKVVEQQEREDIAGKKQKAEVDKQMRQSLSQVGEIAKSLNIDPDRLVELIEPLFQEMGGLEAINQVLGKAAEERDTKQATKQAEVQQQDKKRIAKLTGQGQQATAQVEKEVARLGEATGKQERLAVASSEAKVLAKRAKEKQSSDARKVATEKQREKNLAEQAKTGLEDKKKYPDKKLLKRLSDLQFRNIDEKLSSIETKEMETIEKEIKNRKLTPLPLG
jgi:hypothetical protein